MLIITASVLKTGTAKKGNRIEEKKTDFRLLLILALLPKARAIVCSKIPKETAVIKSGKRSTSVSDKTAKNNAYLLRKKVFIKEERISQHRALIRKKAKLFLRSKFFKFEANNAGSKTACSKNIKYCLKPGSK